MQMNILRYPPKVSRAMAFFVFQLRDQDLPSRTSAWMLHFDVFNRYPPRARQRSNDMLRPIRTRLRVLPPRAAYQSKFESSALGYLVPPLRLRLPELQIPFPYTRQGAINVEMKGCQEEGV